MDTHKREKIPIEAFWYAPYTKPSRKITVWVSKEACLSHETLYPVYMAFTRMLEYKPESMTVDGVYAAAKLLGVDMSDV